MSHKVSLCLPLNGDLSQRLFDALLTGQIPIVAPDIHDLDAVIPPDLQKRLPVIRFDSYSTESVSKAYHEALRIFDQQGDSGIEKRHVFALEKQTFPERIREILGAVRSLSQQL
jgi:hypothetical protein